MNRVELLEQLSESWNTLPEEMRAEIALLAATDPEIKQAMELSRALSAVHIAHVYPEPTSSDAAFLTSVRTRISGHSAVSYTKLFPTARRVALAASVCVILLVAVIVGGRMPTLTSPSSITSAPIADQLSAPSTASPEMAFSNTPVTESASGADDDDAPPISVDSLANAGVNALELAEYLNVSDVAAQVIDTLDGDTLPLTDELLALDDGTLEEVLNDFEATSFF